MSPMMTAVHALGITQITSWGVSYYCLGILATLRCISRKKFGKARPLRFPDQHKPERAQHAVIRSP